MTPAPATPVASAPAVSPFGRPRRRTFTTSPSTMLAVLTALLVVAFVWWRLSAQRSRVESYWGNLLIGSAQLTRVRTEEWLATQRKAAEMLGVLAARGRGPGSAFEAAAGVALAHDDIAFISIRDGEELVRCTGVPLGTGCVTGSTRYSIPSPDHPQARRGRPAGDGRILIAAAGTIPAHAESPGGVITLWLDPERSLLPGLLRTNLSAVGARSAFVNRDGDSATVLSADAAGTLLPRVRTSLNQLPELFSRPILDNDWLSGRAADGELTIAARAHIPALKWDIYRTLSYDAAAVTFRRELVRESVLAFILGSFVIGLAVWNVRERREQRVRAELMQARLEGLQAQLRPHFLFNALNTIATLIYEDPDAADAMLIRLADLLRLSLELSDDAEIPLRRELEIFDAYIAVERVRFGESLRVTRDIAPEALDIPVMRWLLQPLAENAIKHGAAYTRGAARMDLRAVRDNGTLEITLADDGPNGVEPSPTEGVGLRNTRRRLATLYGETATLSLRRRDGGGTEAILRIPVTEMPPGV